jgi:hypothetical protein
VGWGLVVNTCSGSQEGELTDALKRYVLGSMQQYRTRYLLAKLTQFVEMAFKGMSAPAPSARLYHPGNRAHPAQYA